MGVVGKFGHRVALSERTQIGCSNDIRSGTDAGTLDDVRQYFLTTGALESEFSAMRVSSAERLNPVVDVIRNEEPGELAQDCTVTNGIESLGEIKCNNNDIWVGFK